MAATLIIRMQEILGGKAALGRAVSNPSDLAEIVRAGLPHSSLEAVMHLLNLPVEMLPLRLLCPAARSRAGKNRLA